MHCLNNDLDHLGLFLSNYRKLPVIVSSKNPEYAHMNDDSFIKSEAILFSLTFLLDY